MQAEQKLRCTDNYIIQLSICQDMKKNIYELIIKLFEIFGLVFALTALVTFIINEMR